MTPTTNLIRRSTTVPAGAQVFRLVKSTVGYVQPTLPKK